MKEHDFTVDAEFKALIPPLSPDEFAQLEDNIKRDGCRDPLVVWMVPCPKPGEHKCYGGDETLCDLQAGDGVWTCQRCEHNPALFESLLLDGHNRHEICSRYGIQFDVDEIELDTRDDAKLWIVRNQLGRRNISDFVRAELALIAKPLIEAKAKANQRASGGPVPKNSTEPPIETREVLADMAGVSNNTVRKVEKIKETASPELLQAVRAGEVSINTAADIATLSADRQAAVISDGKGASLAIAKEIRKKRVADNREQRDTQKRDAMSLPLPSGEYRTIVIDPPWPIEKIVRDIAPGEVNFGFEYPTMTIDEITDVGLPVAEDAFVFLWTTHKFLPDSFGIFQTWGVRYLFTMTWHKNGGFQPYGLAQFNSEFVLVGRIGSAEFVDTKAFPTCFQAARREHSRKPAEFYDLVARVSPAPRIEMFSREAREGFDQFGNETGKFAA